MGLIKHGFHGLGGLDPFPLTVHYIDLSPFLWWKEQCARCRAQRCACPVLAGQLAAASWAATELCLLFLPCNRSFGLANSSEGFLRRRLGERKGAVRGKQMEKEADSTIISASLCTKLSWKWLPVITINESVSRMQQWDVKGVMAPAMCLGCAAVASPFHSHTLITVPVTFRIFLSTIIITSWAGFAI